jgi:hypothetical protein
MMINDQPKNTKGARQKLTMITGFLAYMVSPNRINKAIISLGLFNDIHEVTFNRSRIKTASKAKARIR